jgi:hypothetical protein
MTDFDAELEADAAAEADKPIDLASITALAELLLKRETAEAEAEIELKELRAARMVATTNLSDAMKSIKMTKFSLEDGREVKIKDDLTVSVPKKRMGEILTKLRELGEDDMIKEKVIVDGGAGKGNQIAELEHQCQELGLDYDKDESVNSGTLKSWLNRRRNDGEIDDLTFYGAFELTKVTIK